MTVWPLYSVAKYTVLLVLCNHLKQSYVSVKSKLQHAPPGNLPGIWLFWILLFKFPPTRAKMPFKCPTLRSIQVIKCPHPGDISQAKNDRKTVETPSVVEQNLYKYNKNWETLLAYLLRTKVSCKQRKSLLQGIKLNAQLFFVMQHTKRSIKKDPTYWDYYIMTISLTCIIAHLIN